VADKLGSLEKGKLADVVGVPGDAVADIRATERVLFVMKEGEVVKPAPGR
jgi:imidazolonepropionase-like amidohydrolase